MSAMFGSRHPRRRLFTFTALFLLLIALPVADHYLHLTDHLSLWWAARTAQTAQTAGPDE